VAYEIPGFSWSLVAGEDLSGSQYCGVDVEVSTGLAVLPSAGGRVVGVLRNKPAEGGTATVVTTGVVMAKIGATGVVAGNNVTVDTNGKIIQASSGDSLLGVALKTNAAGEIGTILLLNGVAAAAGS